MAELGGGVQTVLASEDFPSSVVESGSEPSPGLVTCELNSSVADLSCSSSVASSSPSSSSSSSSTLSSSSSSSSPSAPLSPTSVLSVSPTPQSYRHLSGKQEEEFRNYTDSASQRVVERHYLLMRSHQTLSFAAKMQSKYGSFNHARMSVREAFRRLEGYVDCSDPDTSLPNLQHMLQTAQAIRAAGHPDWFQLVGLIHDMGKIQYLWGLPQDGQEGTADGDQWALGGDTWVLGCRIPDSIIFPHFNKLNAEMKHPIYSTENGIYAPGCGMDKLIFAWGHDEYLYQMLKFNKAKIPDAGLAVVRYHSCYVWHRENCYTQFMTEKDYEALKWVREFNKFDLYTKADGACDVEELWPYYQSLIDKYMPGELCW